MTPTATPTPMPAFAPDERPSDGGVVVLVLVGIVEEEVVVASLTALTELAGRLVGEVVGYLTFQPTTAIATIEESKSRVVVAEAQSDGSVAPSELGDAYVKICPAETSDTQLP